MLKVYDGSASTGSGGSRGRPRQRAPPTITAGTAINCARVSAPFSSGNRRASPCRNSRKYRHTPYANSHVPAISPARPGTPRRTIHTSSAKIASEAAASYSCTGCSLTPSGVLYQRYATALRYVTPHGSRVRVPHADPPRNAPMRLMQNASAAAGAIASIVFSSGSPSASEYCNATSIPIPSPASEYQTLGRLTSPRNQNGGAGYSHGCP